MNPTPSLPETLAVDKYFLLFACCISVKGQGRSLIADLQRNTFKYVPNLLHDILELCKEHPLGVVMEMLDHEEDDGIIAYLEVLQQEQLGFFTDTPEAFPPLENRSEYPGLISNAIIEFDQTSNYELFSVLDQLQELRCKHVQIRYFGDFGMKALNELKAFLHDAYFYLVEVYIPFHSDMDLSALAELLIAEHRLFPIIVYNCPDSSLSAEIESQSNFVKSRLILTRENFEANKMEEFISETDFTVNTEFFMEARNFNTGLNKKLCIDIEGNSKNHVSHRKSFGQVQTEKLQDIVNQAAFQKAWFLRNDLIEVCKDCEYRFLCLDNTEIIHDESGYKKVKPCVYDPYTMTWS